MRLAADLFVFFFSVTDGFYFVSTWHSCFTCATEIENAVAGVITGWSSHLKRYTGACKFSFILQLRHLERSLHDQQLAINITPLHNKCWMDSSSIIICQENGLREAVARLPLLKCIYWMFSFGHMNVFQNRWLTMFMSFRVYSTSYRLIVC